MTFEVKILWQGPLLDGAVVFTLTAPSIIQYHFSSFDTDLYGSVQVEGCIIGSIPAKLISEITERYINGTVELRDSLKFTLH
jgi:hypothetical protein